MHQSLNSHKSTFIFRLRTDLEENIAQYDKILQGIIENSTSSSTNDPDNIQRDIEQLTNEIDTLTEAARTKELEWNNILYLKKMKEDMLVRLNRKKTVMEIMSSKLIDDAEPGVYNLSNTVNNTSENVNQINSNDVSGSSKNDMNSINVRKAVLDAQQQLNPPTASFIMNRTNMNSSDLAKERSSMNSSDLAKERSNITKLHR